MLRTHRSRRRLGPSPCRLPLSRPRARPSTIGGTVYTFVTTITPQSAADTVLIGADVGSTLANLAGAINASSTNGQAAGTTYGTGTVANALVKATGSTATSLNLQAMNTGAIGNSDATSTAWTAGSFGAADLTGGVSVRQASGTLTVPPPLPTAGQTVTIGGTTYTFAAAITAQSAADTVLIGADISSTLANLAGAINAASTNGQAAGTTYATGTVANATVTATGSTPTALTLQALNSGAAGNSDTTTTNWAAGSFGGAGDLVGGLDALPATATFTVPPGTLPSAGDTVAIGGTTYTFVGTTAGLTAAGDVLIGGSVTTALANLAGAINLSTTNGQGAGATYGTGTAANASVTATGSTATTVTLQAASGGAVGDAIPTATSWTGGLFAVADLSGGATGVSASATLTVPPGTLPNAGDTVDIAGTTYTFVGTTADLTAAGNVLIGGSATTTLANLAGAINLSTTNGQGVGATYGTGTVANASVTATGSTATTVTLQAIQSGAGGNSLGISTSWTGGLFGAADLAGGADVQQATGTLTVPPPLPTAGQTATVGGTTYTFVATKAALTAADDVLIGADVPSTLANLAGAINLSTANGQGAGVTYGAGTVANASVTATGSTATSLTLHGHSHWGSGQQFHHHHDQLDRGFIRGRRPRGRRGRADGDRGLHGAGFAPDRGPDRYRRRNDLHLCGKRCGPDRARQRSDRTRRHHDPCQPGVCHQRDPRGGGPYLRHGHHRQHLGHCHGFHIHHTHPAGNSKWFSWQFHCHLDHWTNGSFGAGDLTGGTDAGTFSDSHNGL